MTSTEPALPEYAKPPVVEVVFAVSIAPMALSMVDLARFGWEHLHDLPKRTEQPPMAVSPETLEGIPNLGPSLAILVGPPPVRLWFQSEDDTRLVQLQRDWMAYNWQGASTSSPYPRYGAVESSFLNAWDALGDFVQALGQPIPSVTQCELSYINHVLPGTTWERHGQLANVLRIFGRTDAFLPDPEDAQINVRYRIPHDGHDIGRLYVQAAPAFRQEDRTPLIQLNLTARGQPLAPGRDGLVAFFRLAHEWIVNGFAAVTTDQAQNDLWERVP
jgi:uncharacterized protein (TIGR04255 family)